MRQTSSRIANVLSWVLLGLAVLIGFAMVVLVITGVGLAAGIFGEQALANLGSAGTSKAGVTVSLVVIAIGIAAALPLVLILRRVLQRVARGEPFHPGHPRDLRMIAVLLAVLEIGTLITFLAVPLLVTLPPDISGVIRVDYELNLTSWLAVLIILVLAEVFREGARLRAEAELTV